MIRPIYDYYINSPLNLEEALEDYVDNFYLKNIARKRLKRLMLLCSALSMRN